MMVRRGGSVAVLAVSTALILPARAAAQSTANRVARAAIGVGGGALVGTWLGYFASQVGSSDWEKMSGDERSELRARYARSGAAAGAVVGYFLRPAPPKVGAGLPQPGGVSAREGRQLLLGAELRRSIATNVLEAVELARPEWIKALRDDERRAGPTKSAAAVEATSLVVYVGDERVGPLESLRDVALPEVLELRYYDARDARHRWGLDHRYGAIEIVPADEHSASPAGTMASPVATPMLR